MENGELYLDDEFKWNEILPALGLTMAMPKGYEEIKNVKGSYICSLKHFSHKYIIHDLYHYLVMIASD